MSNVKYLDMESNPNKVETESNGDPPNPEFLKCLLDMGIPQGTAEQVCKIFYSNVCHIE